MTVIPALLEWTPTLPHRPSTSPRGDVVTEPYYQHDGITLYHGDCREITEWLHADTLVTDPPYGRAWRQGRLSAAHRADDSRDGIRNDESTAARDAALELWGGGTSNRVR